MFSLEEASKPSQSSRNLASSRAERSRPAALGSRRFCAHRKPLPRELVRVVKVEVEVDVEVEVEVEGNLYTFRASLAAGGQRLHFVR